MVSIAHTTLTEIEKTLDTVATSFGPFNELLDKSQLLEDGRDLFHQLPRNSRLDTVYLPPGNIPLDRVSLLFATLALFNLSKPSHSICSAFLDLSISMVELYADRSTFELALAIFMQHSCVLRTGTASRSRALIHQAIQVAQEAGLHKNRLDTRGLHLYIILYFADQ